MTTDDSTASTSPDLTVDSLGSDASSTAATSSPPFDPKAALMDLMSSSDDGNSTSSPQVLQTDRLFAGLDVITPQVTTSGLTVDNISSLNDAINFMSDAIFFGRPYFNTDTAGFAVIAKGQQSVDVKFDNPYEEQPIVNATITLDGADDDANVAAAGDIFNNGIEYLVTNKSDNGFTILLNKPAVDDTTFSWTAFAVKNAKTFGTPSDYTLPAATSSTPIQTAPNPSDASSTDDSSATSTDDTSTATSTDDSSGVSTTTPPVATSTPDTTPPVITLNGSNPVNLTVGDSYADAGATATDNVDGTDPVTTAGSVDTTTAGVYTITYSASDAAGNTATATRTVNVAAPSDDASATSTATSTGQ